jgi:hypothetical protein
LSRGWEISDLTRTLVILAATGIWSALNKKKNLRVLEKIAVLGRTHGVIERRLVGAKRTQRPYRFVRSSRDTDIVTLILPDGVAELIESYSAVKMVSKNDLCEDLLNRGLIVYLTAEQRILQALLTVKELAEKPSARVLTRM